MADHYQVLGIRPNATALEIDLAYKGRRTQYHPDRYGAADAETVRWATQAMQAVNEAYAVLADEARRAAYDRQLNAARASAPAPSANATPPNPAPARPDPGVREALVKAFEGRPGRRVHIAPSIPLKKLSNALEGVGIGLAGRDVVALVDTTIFGGGGDGILVTDSEVRVKESFSTVNRFRFDELADLQAEDGDLYLTGRKLLNCSMVDSHELMTFAATMRSVAMRVREVQPAAEAKHNESEGSAGVMLLGKVAIQLAGLLRAIEPLEGGRAQFIDRDNAAQEFADLQEDLDDPEVAEEAVAELECIGELCEIAQAGLAGRFEQMDLDFMRPDRDESQLIQELKRLGLMLRYAKERAGGSAGR